jgi:hypothetical protein
VLVLRFVLDSVFVLALVHSLSHSSTFGVDPFTARWDDGDGDVTAVVACIMSWLGGGGVGAVVVATFVYSTVGTLMLPLPAQLVSIQPQGTWVLSPVMYKLFYCSSYRFFNGCNMLQV